MLKFKGTRFDCKLQTKFLKKLLSYTEFLKYVHLLCSNETSVKIKEKLCKLLYPMLLHCTQVWGSPVQKIQILQNKSIAVNELAPCYRIHTMNCIDIWQWTLLGKIIKHFFEISQHYRIRIFSSPETVIYLTVSDGMESLHTSGRLKLIPYSFSWTCQDSLSSRIFCINLCTQFFINLIIILFLITLIVYII